METIFDHNVTREELDMLIGNPNMTIEKFLSLGLSRVQHYTAIYKLYLLRKDKEKANIYLDKIPDSLTKRYTICNHDFAT